MEKEIFFNPPFDGEMLPLEKYKLYNWVLEIKPKIVFEIGTGLGGGSTFYISKAISELNNGGQIYTCDTDRGPSEQFFKEFQFVNFYRKKSEEFLKDLINIGIVPELIMFDGPEDPKIAHNDIIFLEKYINNGTYFCMHDWDLERPYDNNKSTKSIMIRDYMEKSSNWELIEKLDSKIKNSDFDDLKYDSVGMCLYKYKK